ncbi:unnamed protein product [Rhizophagus irregularis]|nr:unnamed protein product [Rhizophagus irregularis]
MGQLANCSNIKYRDNIGGLCLTGNDYGYIPFESLIAIARNTFLQKDQLNSVLQKIDALKRHLRRDYYEKELVVNADGTTKHDSCISHCLPYAFGNCLENHNSQCLESTLASLDENGALFVADYKMRILPRSARETKAEFFEIRAYNHWSTDTKQDAWFTASLFEAGFETIKHKPK